MPIVTLPLASVVAAPVAANVMVLPLTEKLSPAAGPVGVATVPSVSALMRVGAGCGSAGGAGLQSGAGSCGGICERCRAPEIERGRAGHGKAVHRRFLRIADLGLQNLVGDRLRGIDQLLQRGQASVRRLKDLHAIADAIEQTIDVAGAVIERGSGEEVGRVVERGVDLLAGSKAVLRGCQQIGGRLQGQQVLANGRRENDIGHGWTFPLGRVGPGRRAPPIALENLELRDEPARRRRRGRREARQPRGGPAVGRWRRRRRGHRRRPRTDLFNPNAIRPASARSSRPARGRARDRRSRGCRPAGSGSSPRPTPDRYVDADLRGPLAIVLGSEPDGLTSAWRQAGVERACPWPASRTA